MKRLPTFFLLLWSASSAADEPMLIHHSGIDGLASALATPWHLVTDRYYRPRVCG